MPGGNLKYRYRVLTIGILLLFPVILLFSTLLKNRNYGLVSFLMVILALVPFFLQYEKKKPLAREWIPLVVMAALAAVGRVVFAPLPHFKPISAIIIVTAMVFGAEAGFLTGAISALASNLFFGQGPWTPWQMFAWGLIGFLAGLLSKQNRLNGTWQITLFGLFSGFLYGWIMNVWSAATMLMSQMSFHAFMALYLASLPNDLVHGISTVVFLMLIEKSWTAKLRRVKIKFGIIAGD